MPTESLAALVCSLVATYVVHSTLFLAAAWLLLTRCRSHEWTCRGWRTAAVLGLVTAPLQVFTGFSPFAFRFGDDPDQPRAAPAVVREVPLPSVDVPMDDGDVQPEFEPAITVREPRPLELEDGPGPEPDDESIVVEEPADREEQFDVRSPPLPPRPVTDPPNEPSLLTEASEEMEESVVAADDRVVVEAEDRSLGAPVVAAMLLGAIGFGLLRTFVLFVRTRRWANGGTPLQRGPGRRVLNRLLADRGIRRPVELVERADLANPAACGGLRWRILLPQGLADQATPDGLEAILAHELAHLVRRDGPWLWVGQVLVWCLWIQPMNRLATARWQRSSEFLCDGWAVAGGVRPTTLARCLTDLAEAPAVVVPAIATTAVSSRPVLVERVESLLCDPPHPASTWATTALALVLLAVTPFAPAILFSAGEPRVERPTVFVEPLEPVDPQGATATLDDWSDLDRELRALDEELERLRRRTATRPSDELTELIEALTSHRTSLDARRRALDARLRPTH